MPTVILLKLITFFDRKTLQEYPFGHVLLIHITVWIAPSPDDWTDIKQHREGSLKRLVTHVVATRSDQELLLQYYAYIPTLTHMYTQEHKDFQSTYR